MRGPDRGLGIALLLMGWLGAAPLAGQISPGPLSRPHAQLEGALKCTQCHGTRKEALPGQCLACHKEIAALQSAGRGLHALEGRTACASCHPEHAGGDFALVAWSSDSTTRFDHGRAGWKLEGAHAQVACTKCHRAELRTSPVARLLPGTRRGAGFVGLEQECTACHRDIHRGGLGQQCTSCHGMDKWNPAPRFDHASTSYPLTGAHTEVPCAKCHQDPRWATNHDSTGAVVPVFKPVPHAECASCHRDPHAGKFGGSCSECHQTRSFTVIDGREFNHAKTRYPLVGKHAAVACKACHEPGGVKKQDPPFATCTACHADAHNGLAIVAGAPADCAACHTPQGFVPATFTVAQHAKTAYPLEGKHQQVNCGSCHVRQHGAAARGTLGSALVVMRPVFAACTDCHQQDHGTQLGQRADHGQCSVCHTVAGWSPSSFGVADHAHLRFDLTGAHATTACRNCHDADRRGLPALPASLSAPAVMGRARIVFRIPETGCVDCHVDSHRGALAAQRAGGVDGACTACHDSRHFRPSTIDVAAHRKYGFALDGAHGAIPCTSCHTTIGAARPTATLVGLRHDAGAAWLFPTKGRACVACHTSPHGDQFAARTDHGACESCHGTDGFAPASRFDHGRDTSFPLTGGHAGIACTKCHVTESAGGQSPRVRYRPVSPKCESCHGTAMPKRGGA